MRLDSIFLMIIVVIVSLTGCTADKQDSKASIPAPAVDIGNNNLPALLPTIDDAEYSEEIAFTNGYKSNLIEDERYIIVEAGALKNDPKQGVAIIKTINKDGTIIKEEKLLTPEKHGSIKIDSINAFNMEVTAEDGFKWILNVYDGFRTKAQQ
ncbi:MAG: hypothetical protein K0R84_321 [Clostridia bacterium]|nr:hypothetical protein [Clostridia bacterium]